MRISDWSSDVCSSDLTDRRSAGSSAAGGPGLVAEGELLDLAGGRLGQLAPDDPLRSLEPGQSAAHVLDELFVGYRCPGVQDDEGHGTLAPTLAVGAEDGAPEAGFNSEERREGNRWRSLSVYRW